jgi:hypothetical protein
MIERQRRQSTLTAAIRVFVMTYFRMLAQADAEATVRDEATRLLTEAWHPHVMWRAVARAGDDFEERTRWSDAVLQASRDAGFLHLYQVWQEIRALRGTAPSIADLIDHGLADEIVAGNLNVIDVTAENPANFRLTRSCAQSTWFYSGDVTGELIADLPFRLHADALLADFNRAKSDGAPALFWIDHQFRGLRRTYLRLLLPVSDAPRRITALVSVVRGKNTVPSIYEEPVFGRRLPSLQQIRHGIEAAPESRRLAG